MIIIVGQGAMMFDFPSFVPTLGDHHRYNEEWYVAF
jgi:L-gulonolactone oxidase